MKDKGFLGMIIPKKYGGLEFSAYAHSANRDQAVDALVSAGGVGDGAELARPGRTAAALRHRGTEEPLPAAPGAKAIEVPAFALTSPWAGSDAAVHPGQRHRLQGRSGRASEVIGMRVTWDKRYITLAPVCTVLGLAFRLYDPDGLLGGKKDIWASPARWCRYDHPGVDTGRRHFPLNAMFMNGPTRGKDVFMPLDFIIGGPKPWPARAGAC